MAENEVIQNAPPQQAAIDAEQVEVTTIRPPNMPSIYINSAGFAVGALEIRLFVGETIPNPDGKGVTNTQKLCLVMSPDLIKPLINSLSEAVKNFEGQFGKLREVTVPHK
jgi:hypothetical protein